MSSLKQVHMSASSLIGKRLSFEQRLCLLAIDESDYRKYEEMFLRYREASHYIQRTEDSWVAIKHPWNKREVLRHLTGERTIGLFPGEKLDYMMIDIDRHDNEDQCTLKSRIDKIKKVIPGQPLLYQSSFSGGLRLCYFLAEPMPKRVLYEGFKKLTVTHNLTVKPGQLEIMATNTGDRLPFGEGSYLVDPFDLGPIYHLSLKETIAISFEAYQYCKIEIPFTIESGVQVSVATKPGDGLFDSIVNRLVEEGLYPGITTNDALLKLNWDLQIRKGYSRSETEKFLICWIMTKHNNLSNRFNAGRTDQIRDQIHRIVVKTDPSKAKYPSSKYALRTKRLSLSDVRRILTLTEGQKLQLAIFSLLEYCLCFGKKAQTRNEDKPLISNLYGSGKRHVTYRSGSLTNFYCEISKKTLQHLPGFDKANPQTTMAKVEALGLLSLKRRAHPESHHCRQYWVHFEFNEDDPEKVISLDEGSARLKQSERSCRDIENKKIGGGVIKE